MTYHQIIQLKNGASCCLRSGTAADGQAARDNFILTHAETDNLLTYPEENTLTATQEDEYLQAKTASPNEVEILAIVDGKVAGTAGINAVGGCYKLQHRAEFGISIAKEFWGLGIGQALTDACIDCARKAGYAQLELDVVADNASALALYKKFGFVEYGRNPKGFRSRNTGYQELVLMRLCNPTIKRPRLGANRAGQGRFIVFMDYASGLSNSLAISSSSLRMGRCCGQIFSHLPHFRQSEARRPGAVWTSS